jgi:hypothetical protein
MVKYSIKRTTRARYMLLSPAEIISFRHHIEENHPLIYEDEYDVAELAGHDDQEKGDGQHDR